MSISGEQQTTQPAHFSSDKIEPTQAHETELTEVPKAFQSTDQIDIASNQSEPDLAKSLAPRRQNSASAAPSRSNKSNGSGAGSRRSGQKSN